MMEGNIYCGNIWGGGSSWMSGTFDIFEDHDTIFRATMQRRLVEATSLLYQTLPNTPYAAITQVTLYFVSVSSSSPNCSRCLATTLSNFRSRAALVFARLASISSLITLSRAFSALAL